MNVWVFDDNLLWTTRIQRSLVALGHEASVHQATPDGPVADAAIVNLASRLASDGTLIAGLRDLGVKVVGFAGHRDGERLKAGRACGCHAIATNEQVAKDFEKVLKKVSYNGRT